MFRTFFEFSTLRNELRSRIGSTFVLTILLAQAGAAQKYTITDLGILPGGTFSEAWGIDESGRVTGDADDANGVIRAFLYTNGKMSDLGTLPGEGDRNRSFGRGISGGEGRRSERKDNERGERRSRKEVQVTGYSEVDAFGDQHAFLYRNRKMLDLGTLPGGVSSQGYGVNESGQVVGASSVTDSANGVTHAFLYSNGNMLDLGTLLPGGGNSAGNAINRSGEVTGISSTNFGTHAFLYSDGHLSDIGTLPGGVESFGVAINESGEVAGASGTTIFGDFHAFLYSSGTMLDIGTLPEGGDAFGLGINHSGQVVGSAGVVARSRFPAHAFLYSHGKMLDLNSLIPPNSGWVLQEARAINDSGQITGQGVLNGANRSYLLTLVCSEHEGNHIEKHCEEE
jgi:probable HAF family extracellular repeat protein